MKGYNNLLILFGTLGQIMEAQSCSSDDAGLPNVTASAPQKNMSYWEVPRDMKIEWAKWYAEYYLKHNSSSGETDGNVDDNDGRPFAWKGYGPGSGGVPPPPWAYFDGGHGKPDLCFLDSKKGTCTNKLTRWGYNPYMKECVKFVYSGCGGNDNNFLTKAQCDVTCAIDVATNCQLFNEN